MRKHTSAAPKRGLYSIRYLFGVIVWERVVFRKIVLVPDVSAAWAVVDSEDDYRSGSRNISHQQQSF